MTTGRESKLLRRVKILTGAFIVGLVISGATAIPLVSEVDRLADFTGVSRWAASPDLSNAPAWALWLLKVQSALHAVSAEHPFLFYGTDWLAFGHFVIAIAFLGAWRDPVRNRWLYTFGLIACALVVPYALGFGAIRGIPIGWRLIDCSFGVFGFLPLWYCRRASEEIDSKGPGKDLLEGLGESN